MAKIHTLTYNGTKSSDLGVFVSGSGSFDAAEFDVDKYEIPGRNGDLLLSNNRYKNIEITYPAFIPKAFMDKVQNVRNWLRSSKVYARLEDTYDMDHYRLGIPTGAQTFSPENRNDGANFEMTFDCKPQRFLKVGETPETVEADVQTETVEIVTFETVAESPITSASVSLSPIQSGSGDPSPDNIRPISGHTGAELIRTGKNLFSVGELTASDWDNLTNLVSVDAETSSVTINIRASGLTYAHRYIKLKGNATYTFSATTAVTGFRFGVAMRKLDDSGWMTGTDASISGMSYNSAYTGWYKDVNNTLTPTVTVTIPDCLYWCPMIGFSNNGSAVVGNNETIANIKIELGSSATDFEPYQGDTYSVTFSDQGTIYGGTYDFVTGKLTVTHGFVEYDGSADESWTLSSTGTYRQAFRINMPSAKVAATSSITGMMSSCITLDSSHENDNKGVTCRGTAYESIYFYVFSPLAEFSTIAGLRAYLASNPTQICYPLATPLEYTLSPQQITTLQGQNVVWGNGTITLTYAEPYNVENPTLFDARPLFTVTNPAEDDVIMVNGQAITFVDGYTGTVFIDCETMNAYSGAANLNSIIQATDFPVLVPGTNLVTWTGAGECTMTPRWWEL